MIDYYWLEKRVNLIINQTWSQSIYQDKNLDFYALMSTEWVRKLQWFKIHFLLSRVGAEVRTSLCLHIVDQRLLVCLHNNSKGKFIDNILYIFYAKCQGLKFDLNCNWEVYFSDILSWRGRWSRTRQWKAVGYHMEHMGIQTHSAVTGLGGQKIELFQSAKKRGTHSVS